MSSTATIIPDAQEINARVLVAFFGWRWMRNTVNPGKETPKTALIPGEDDRLGYEGANYNPSWWEPSDEHTSRFSDWDQCCFQRGPRGGIKNIGLPDFCGDANLLPLLLDEVQKRHRGSDWAWIVIVGTDSDPHTAPYDALFNAERVPLRKKVAAALKTCGQWPENWRHDAE